MASIQEADLPNIILDPKSKECTLVGKDALIQYPYCGLQIRSHLHPHFAIFHIGRHLLNKVVPLPDSSHTLHPDTVKRDEHSLTQDRLFEKFVACLLKIYPIPRVEVSIMANCLILYIFWTDKRYWTNSMAASIKEWLKDEQKKYEQKKYKKSNSDSPGSQADLETSVGRISTCTTSEYPNTRLRSALKRSAGEGSTDNPPSSQIDLEMSVGNASESHATIRACSSRKRSKGLDRGEFTPGRLPSHHGHASGTFNLGGGKG